MKRHHLDSLATLGVTVERYVDAPTLDDYDKDPIPNWPPRWGIELRRDDRVRAVVDHTPRSSEGDGLYHLRPWRGGGESLGSFRRQQDAVAAFVRREFR